MDFNHLVCYLGLYQARYSYRLKVGPPGWRAIDHGAFDIVRGAASPTARHQGQLVRIRPFLFRFRLPGCARDHPRASTVQKRSSTLEPTRDGFRSWRRGPMIGYDVTMIDLPDQLAEAVSLVERRPGSGIVSTRSVWTFCRTDAQMPRGRCAHIGSVSYCAVSARAKIASLLRRLG